MPENKEQKATPITAETKKSTEPTKAEESKSPTGQKAKTTQEVTKPTGEAKPAPATEAKKPLEAPKPAPSTQTVTSPVDQKKVTEAPKSPGDAKAPVTAEAKKPTEPAKTEEAKSPAGQKAKTTQEVTKPTRESKAAPAAEPKKPSEAPKPAPSTQATTRLVDQQKPPEVPKSPGDAKTPAAAEAKKPAETPKLPSDAKAPVIPAVPDTAKQTLPKGMRITQVIADRLDKPDEKALKDLPVPKEGEGISARLHPDYFFEFLDHPFSINREVADYKDLFDSIKANGINEPVKARPREGGGLELLSGHRRHDVAKQLGYEEIIILDYTASVPLLSSRLGEYARIDELNYLACRLAGMSQEEKAKFSAALEHGDYGGDLSDIIDLTYRLDCYTLLPEIRNYEDYGYHLVESRRDFYLPQKARYYFDFSQYGEDTIINEGGTLTPQGYIRADRGKVFTQVYDGEHIPAEYRVFQYPMEARAKERQPAHRPDASIEKG